MAKGEPGTPPSAQATLSDGVCIAPLEGVEKSQGVEVEVGLTKAVEISSSKSIWVPRPGKSARYVIRIKTNGSVSKTFWADLDKYPRKAVCLWFAPTFKNWALTSVESSGGKCGCALPTRE